MKILITGATGLIGKHLAARLQAAGHEPIPLAGWRADQVPAAEKFRGCDAIVHLAGENIAGGRWSEARKARIMNSRVGGTVNLLKGVAAAPSSERPKILIGASGVGFYGSRGDEELTEKSAAGSGFLADVCKEWEAEENRAADLGLRVVNLRTGMVLAREGGALKKMGPFILGDGRQWMSWIHIEDEVGLIVHALENSSLSGPVNLVSPHPVRHREFAEALKKVRGYPLNLPVPAIALRAAMGEMSQLVLDSQRVIPARALSAGYSFRFPHLAAALSAAT